MDELAAFGITVVYQDAPTFFDTPVLPEPQLEAPPGLLANLEADDMVDNESHTPTTVYAHIPNVPKPSQRYREGMKPLDNRRNFLACYEAFKPFVV